MSRGPSVCAQHIAAAAAPSTAASSSTETFGSLTRAQTVFFAGTVGVIVVNLSAAQPLIGPVSQSLHLPASLAGLIATLPQLGYAIGLLLLVPLCDLLENRRLVVRTLACCAAFLAVSSMAHSGVVFLISVFLAGATSSVIQMLVPMAASMAAENRRGRAVGNVMSGLMIGILLSRPLASVVTGAFGWRAFYGVEAVADAMIAVVLYFRLPDHTPRIGARYPALLASLWTLLRTEPVLRHRATQAALALGVFSAFWTAIALRLAQPPFSLGMRGVAVFALAGASGAIVTPLAGYLGDRGAGRSTQIVAHLVMLAAILMLGAAGAGWGGFSAAAHPGLALGLLVAGAAALDAGVITDQTLGRRAINLINPLARGRLNALFVGIFFIGGAFGAALSGAAWAWAGWSGVCMLALTLALLLLVCGWVERAGQARGR
ncbi:MFS transporter [Pandoraea pnomenusa]|uniref:MFS transporter n=1 Tax=Pandoraea pnomenusa TaxID=93220 RepID=A0ABY6WMJ0_9BURK|nr:MFS transporter [Pandoraea pnomenusa]VVE68122.1 MFS transporter [Pandoraea pnomenusa]